MPLTLTEMARRIAREFPRLIRHKELEDAETRGRALEGLLREMQQCR